MRISVWVWVAVLLTAGYLWACFSVLSSQQADTQCASGQIQLFNACLKLNEIGDLAAGIFAPVAFIWLVVAVLVQAQELSAQREDIKLTRYEMEAQRQVWEEQLDETRAQTRVLTVEAEERSTAQADRELDMLLRAIARLVVVDRSALMFDVHHYVGPGQSAAYPATIGPRPTFDPVNARDVDEVILALGRSAKLLRSNSAFVYLLEATPNDSAAVDLALSALGRISEIRPRVSDASRIRLDTLWVDDLRDIINQLSNVGTGN